MSEWLAVMDVAAQAALECGGNDAAFWRRCDSFDPGDIVGRMDPPAGGRNRQTRRRVPATGGPLREESGVGALRFASGSAAALQGRLRRRRPGIAVDVSAARGRERGNCGGNCGDTHFSGGALATGKSGLSGESVLTGPKGRALVAGGRKPPDGGTPQPSLPSLFFQPRRGVRGHGPLAAPGYERPCGAWEEEAGEEEGPGPRDRGLPASPRLRRTRTPPGYRRPPRRGCLRRGGAIRHPRDSGGTRCAVVIPPVRRDNHAGLSLPRAEAGTDVNTDKGER